MSADAIADGPEPEDDETPQPREHTRLGEYRLVQRLGEGGMGVVHLALDRHGRAVAIKVLRQHIAHDPDARARLTREVSSLSRITSPRVAPIIDADVDGPTPYIVTRYVPGPSLDDYVAERSTPSTRPGWCTATSSRATCCWSTATRCSSTSASRTWPTTSGSR
jgi:serine/threonine protein kinase